MYRLSLFVIALCIPPISFASADQDQQDITRPSPATIKLLNEIAANEPDSPILIDAFVSRQAPRDHASSIRLLRSLLENIRQLGEDRVTVNLRETEANSDAARNAYASYGIKPVVISEGVPGVIEGSYVFSHVVVRRGTRTIKIPVFQPGAAVELELFKAFQDLTTWKRRRLGVLVPKTSNAQSNGFEPLLNVLKSRYGVVEVAADNQVDAKVDVLLAIQPSLLERDQLASLIERIKSGVPAAVFEDPLPMFYRQLATPSQPALFGQQIPKTPRNEVDITPLFKPLGLKLDADHVVWDQARPAGLSPEFHELPPEYIIVAREMPGNNEILGDCLAPDDRSVASLRQLSLVGPAMLTITNQEGVTATPLIRTTNRAGRSQESVIAESLRRPGARRASVDPEGTRYVLAARVRATDEGSPSIHVVVTADVDCLSLATIEMPASGRAKIQLDNRDYLFNVIDSLAGDDSFITLRGRRAPTPKPSEKEIQTLQLQERVTAEYDERSKAVQTKFRERFDALVKAIKAEEDPTKRAEQLQRMQVHQVQIQRQMDIAIEQLNRERDRENQFHEIEHRPMLESTKP